MVVEANDPAFDNARFWDARYVENPLLGSGIGSRGDNLLYKRQVIRAFIAGIAPVDILDVGCGDHEVLGGQAWVPDYVGIDISSVVIRANSAKFPDRRFIHLDFAAVQQVDEFRADAVLCMEVLIHQHRRELYDALVRNLVAAARREGLVSGYVTNPRPAVTSAIIAWHEPLTDTLRKAGARNVRIAARSLESEHLAFIAFDV